MGTLREGDEKVSINKKYNEFNEEIFNFASVLRAMNLIKFKLIS